MNRKNIKLIIGLILLVLIPLLIYNSSTFILYVINLSCIYGIVAIGLNLLIGFTGQISLGHAAFLSIGAYLSAFLTSTVNMPFLFSLVISGFISMLFGILLGIPSLRLSGPYLAIATLGFGTVVNQVIGYWEEVTGGYIGIWVNDANLFGLAIDNEIKYYYLILIILIAFILFSRNIIKTKAGRAFIAIRDSETAAQALGINLAKYKLLAFAISAFFAGIAGSVYAHMVGYLSPTNFTLEMSINFLMIIVVGGMTSIYGGVVGAFIVTCLPFIINQLARYLPEVITNTAKTLPQVTIAICVILIILYLPNGMSQIRLPVLLRIGKRNSEV